MAGPRPGSRILQARAQPSSPGFQYFSVCLRGLRSLPSTINQRPSCKVWMRCSLGMDHFRPRGGRAVPAILTCSTTSLLVTSPPLLALPPQVPRISPRISLQCLDRRHNKPHAASRTANWVQAPFVQHRAGDIIPCIESLRTPFVRSLSVFYLRTPPRA